MDQAAILFFRPSRVQRVAIEAHGILFKVRVVGKELQEKQNTPNSTPPATPRDTGRDIYRQFEDDPDLRLGFCWSSAMLERGVYVHPWHNMFICAAMTEADVDNTIDRAADAFALTKNAGAIEPAAKLQALRTSV